MLIQGVGGAMAKMRMRFDGGFHWLSRINREIFGASLSESHRQPDRLSFTNARNELIRV
jgi:hypothetical protein